MNSDIDDLRKELDSIDKELVALLARRFQITERVGHYKAAHNLAAIDSEREAHQFERIEKLAKEYGLSPDFAKKHLRLIIDEVVKRHQEIRSAGQTSN